MKFFDAEVDGSSVTVCGHAMALAPAGGHDGPVVVGVRPEGWRLTTPGDGIAVTVGVVETLGADAYLYGTARVDGGDADVIARIGNRERVGTGDTVHVTADRDAIHLFDRVTGERLS
jgi:multiple sugar transport system ATP-binding protein